MRIEKIITLDSVDSTNNFLKQNTLNGNVCVRALTQTSGRGRLGRSFLSPKGGVYFSVLFKCENKQLATIAAAVVVEQCLDKSFIKWPNDILIDGKKACGILCECCNYDDRIIVGIGINVKKAPLDTACAVGGEPDRLFNIVIKKFEEIFTLLENDPQIVLSLYRNKLFMPSLVSTLDSSEKIVGHVVGIDDDGRLLICDQDNIVHTISHGEVLIIEK